jgi:hypothetical protein
MKQFLVVASAFFLVVSVSGCGGMKGESETKEAIKLTNEMADAMEAKDKDKIEATKKKLEDLKKKMDDLKLTDDEKKKLEEKYKADSEKAQKRVEEALKKSLGI